MAFCIGVVRECENLCEHWKDSRLIKTGHPSSIGQNTTSTSTRKTSAHKHTEKIVSFYISCDHLFQHTTFLHSFPSPIPILLSNFHRATYPFVIIRVNWQKHRKKCWYSQGSWTAPSFFVCLFISVYDIVYTNSKVSIRFHNCFLKKQNCFVDIQKSKSFLICR